MIINITGSSLEPTGVIIKCPAPTEITMPAPSLPSAKVIHVDTRGAVILAEESAEVMERNEVHK